MPDYVRNTQYVPGSKFREKLAEKNMKLSKAAWSGMEARHPGKMHTLYDAYKLVLEMENSASDGNANTYYEGLKSGGGIAFVTKSKVELGASANIDEKNAIIHGHKTPRQAAKDSKGGPRSIG
tara:strand:- start:447 stop:815 length:369 start_codon:yes stop_codon:yes gene_type:complete